MIAATAIVAGCGDPDAGTFSAAASEKAAAEKGIKGPGPAASQASSKPEMVRTKQGLVPRAPGASLPKAD